MTDDEVREARAAAIVAAYLIRGLIMALVVVGLWCQVDTQRDGWVLLWVAGAAMAGSAGVDYLVRVVCRLAPGSDSVTTPRQGPR